MARYSAKPGQGAKLYFTDFNISHNMIDVTSWGDEAPQRIAGFGEIRFSGVMPATDGSRALMLSALNSGGLDIFQERQEWRCLHCASPNPIEHRHCSQCGAPRGWIL